MAANKKPRKAYRPRPNLIAHINAAKRVDQLRQVEALPVTTKEVDQFRIAVLGALDGIARGTGTAKEWNSLASALRHAYTLAHDGTGEEIMPTLIVANDGMLRARERFERTGRMGFDGAALRDIREALNLWFEQLLLCNIGEVDAATRFVGNEYQVNPMQPELTAMSGSSEGSSSGGVAGLGQGGVSSP